MKKIYTAIITSILSLQTLAISAGNVADYAQSTTSGNSIVYINAPRFVRPLIEKWIAEYKKLKPEANFAIAKTQAAKNSSLLNILLSDVNPSEKTDKKTVFFGSYAILPITSKDSEAAKSLENQELTTKKIKALYFENEELDEQDKKNKFSNIVIYTGNDKGSVSREFAEFFGKDNTSFRGKRIVGDDLFLISAISKDPQGVSFNTLGNIYDLSSRKVKDNISILNISYNKEEKAALSEESNIDQLLDVLESNKASQIPTEKIGFTYDDNDIEVTKFLVWILSTGEQYNHQYGILRLDRKLLAQQAKYLPNLLAEQK